MSLDTIKAAAIDSLSTSPATVSETTLGVAALNLDVSDWVTLVAALIGVLIGAFLSNLHERRTKRTELTYEMHREFFGTEMGTVRFNARKQLPYVAHLTFRQLDDDTDHWEQNLPIWMMVRFYERLSVMVERGEVHRRVVPDLFGGSFLWWYGAYFDHASTNVDWHLATSLKHLHDNMKKCMEGKVRRERFLDRFRSPAQRRAPMVSETQKKLFEHGVAGRKKILAEALVLGVTHTPVPHG